MIHNKMYGLYFPYEIHYICGMTLTCNGTSYCICTGTSHFMGGECMVEVKRLIWWLISGLGAVGQSPTKSHGCMTWKNLCRVIARRA